MKRSVPPLCANVPAVYVKAPPTLRIPLVAVKAPPLSVNGPLTVMAAALPVKAAPAWFQPLAPSVIVRPAPWVMVPA